MRYLIFILITLSSCYTEYYAVNKLSVDKSPITGYNMSGYGKVLIKQTSKGDAIQLMKNTKTSLKFDFVTQFYYESYFKFIEGSSFNIHLRTTRVDFENDDQGLKITIGKDRIETQMGEEIITLTDISLNENDYNKLKILSDGKRVKVFINCDEIMDYNTRLEATEYLIIDSKDSEIVLTGLDYTEIFPQNPFEF